MMRRCLGAALLALALALGTPAHAAEPIAQVSGLVRETITVPFGPTPVALEAVVTRPAGAGKYPLLVLSHGTPRNADDRQHVQPNAHSDVAIAFARRGWAVVAVVRRGYGRSAGKYVESAGECGHRDFVKSGHTSAEDVIETVKAMSRQPYVDATRVMLVGVSAGGFASIAAAAQQPPGVRAVLNFAGGRGSNAPDSVCDADRLVAAYGQFGKTVRVPTLWLYSENDHFFGPKLARHFFTAFTASGGTGEFVALPAIGQDGHQLMGDDAVPHWRDRVDAFLRQQKLPTWNKPIAEKPAVVRPPPGLSAHAREEFERYLATSHFEKAFAVSPKTHGYGWVSGRRTPEDAARDALDRCAKNARDCRIYAVNERLAR